MKTRENKAMRFASVLLVLTLLATSLTAGTFAKYTTGAEGAGKARVAKFGVDVSVQTDKLFGKNYNDYDANNEDSNTVNTEASPEVGGISVSASASEMAVAPGTTGFMTFTISGNPETRVKLDIKMTGVPEVGEGATDTTIKEVMLKAGTYQNGQNGEQVKLDADYYPVKWTLKKGETVVTNNTEKYQDTTLSEIEKYLESNAFSKVYAPNELNTVAGTYTLSWEWDFDAMQGANDGADTILGDLAVEGNEIGKQKEETQQFDKIGKNDYCLNEEFKLTISVTQAD